MYELKKNGNVFASKCVGTGPSSYENRIYRAAVSQRLRNTVLGNRMTWRNGRLGKAYCCYTQWAYVICILVSLYSTCFQHRSGHAFVICCN